MKAIAYLRKIVLPFFLLPVISFAQQKDVRIRIIQDESIALTEFQTNITLKKKAFKFQIMLQNTPGVYIFASLGDSVYRYTENSPIRDFSYLKLLELRDEDHFNLNRELNISETGWSYWFYNDSAEWHPFNRKVVGLGENRIVCTKAIKQLYAVEDGQQVKFKSIETPLYLFFIAIKDYDENGKPVNELLRRKVKIDWIDGE